MLLQRIVEALDAELKRLQAIREIVATLGPSPKPKRPMAAKPAKALANPAEPTEPKTAPRRWRRLKPRVRKLELLRSQPIPELTALSGRLISAAPVVLTAAEVARDREARLQRQHAIGNPKAPPTMDEMALSLQRQWLETGT